MAKRRKKRKSKKRLKKRKKKYSTKKKVFKIKPSKETKDADGNLVFKVPENWSKQAYVNKSQYEKKNTKFFCERFIFFKI